MEPHVSCFIIAAIICLNIPGSWARCHNRVQVRRTNSPPIRPSDIHPRIILNLHIHAHAHTHTHRAHAYSVKGSGPWIGDRVSASRGPRGPWVSSGEAEGGYKCTSLSMYLSKVPYVNRRNPGDADGPRTLHGDLSLPSPGFSFFIGLESKRSDDL
ncbi:hypothetical protein BDW74DRAFT_145703 [Aspergillus multicolor]|uniref:uncharacterized protein n=1 Tax=Aspergillus multicolor TaxID=41759 RepID=UPI003CCE3905